LALKAQKELLSRSHLSVRRPRKSLPPSIATDCKYWGAVKEESYKR
jgi:hypothetical protein